MINKNQVTIFIIFCIILFASVTRLFKLGEIPQGLSWDEAAVGYNGWSIWTTRRDEWLNFLPVSFKSFGDYKAPLAIYMNGASTTLFGFENWAIRLPYALSAIFSIIIFCCITQLLAWKGYFSSTSALYGAIIFAALPWHIHFSRISFESTISLLLVLLAVFCIVLFDKIKERLESKHHESLAAATSIGVAFFLSLSLYAYHSSKIFVPVLLILLTAIFRKTIFKERRIISIFVLSLIIFSLPLLRDSLLGAGGTRSDVLIKVSVSRPLDSIKEVAVNVLQHLEPDYVLFGKTDTLRHGDGAFGILLPGMLCLLLIGLFLDSKLFLVRSGRFADVSRHQRLFLITIAWLVAGMLPGWISQDAPHANRTLLALPSLILFAMLGWDYLHTAITQSNPGRSDLARSVLGICILVDILWFIGYQHHYYYVFSKNSDDAFQSGYAEIHDYLASRREAGTLPSTVVFSGVYGQPQIYALLYEKINPVSYHQNALKQYVFVERVNMGDLSRADALIVSTVVDRLPVQEVDSIRSKSGVTRFYVYDSIVEK